MTPAINKTLQFLSIWLPHMKIFIIAYFYTLLCFHYFIIFITFMFFIYTKGRCQVVVGKNLFHKIPLNSNDQIRYPNSSLKTGIWHFPIPAAYIHSLHWLNRIYMSFIPFHSFLIIQLVYGHGLSSPVFLLHDIYRTPQWECRESDPIVSHRFLSVYLHNISE